jgi:hypothetical protein
MMLVPFFPLADEDVMIVSVVGILAMDSDIKYTIEL